MLIGCRLVLAIRCCVGFGALQVLNVMDSYGCSAGFRTPHVDRLLIMCNHNFYNESWADDRDPDTPDPATTIAINHTGPTGCEWSDTLPGRAVTVL